MDRKRITLIIYKTTVGSELHGLERWSIVKFVISPPSIELPNFSIGVHSHRIKSILIKAMYVMIGRPVIWISTTNGYQLDRVGQFCQILLATMTMAVL